MIHTWIDRPFPSGRVRATREASMKQESQVHVYSRVDAKRVLEEQQNKARQIQSRFTRGIEAVHERRMKFTFWLAETHECLLALFDDRSVGDDFYSVAPIWPSDSAPVRLHYDAVQRYLMQALDRLHAILGRLEVIPEAASDTRIAIEPSSVEASPGALLPPILDDVLRSRVADILSGQGPYDRAVREAGVVLEDRVRSRAGVAPTLVGVDLMSAAFRRGGALILSNAEAEQEAAHQLYRGFIGFFKNPSSHRLTTVTGGSARALVAFVDVLLGIVDSSRLRTEPRERDIT